MGQMVLTAPPNTVGGAAPSRWFPAEQLKHHLNLSVFKETAGAVLFPTVWQARGPDVVSAFGRRALSSQKRDAAITREPKHGCGDAVLSTSQRS